MKNKETKPEELKDNSKANLLALGASKIKGKSLFSKKVERAKEILSKARFVK